MALTTAEAWNREFAITGQLEFDQTPEGLVVAHLWHPDGEALVSTYGAQVLHFRSSRHPDDLLYVSPRADYRRGTAIRGGIPICWPWFGPDPEGRGRPAHGLARTAQWRPVACARRVDGRLSLELALNDDEASRRIWPHAFSLRLEVVVGQTLHLRLETQNRGDAPFTISQALHSYFLVGDIERATVRGLENGTYIDKLDADRRKVQQGKVMVDGPLDRIYLQTTDAVCLEDASLGRLVDVRSEGSATTVVWNPWIEGAAKFADLPDRDYRHMLCVESANAVDDRVELGPGDTHVLGVQYSLRKGSPA